MKSYLKNVVVVLSLGLISINNGIAQNSVKNPLPNGWYLQDLKETGNYGISLDKAYKLLKDKKSKTVLVAVIDGGVDTLQEDLKDVLWHNPKEIPGNGVDDDKNGYTDDIYGWNFLGGKDGKNIGAESLERDRVYYQYKDKYEGKEIKPESLSKDEKFIYEMWSKAKEERSKDDENTSSVDMAIMKLAFKNMTRIDTMLQDAIGKPVFTGTELDKYKPYTEKMRAAKEALLELMKANDALDATNKEFMDGFKEYLDQEERKADARTNPPRNYRAEIVKDNYTDYSDRYYGNGDVFTGNHLSSYHGTHVSGIIGAKRNNNIGIDGVADNVKIMMIRVVPDGDERDKDVALAIRYAVDNGAQVVNMSFGKYFSPEKKWVDDAVKYAQEKGVLLVSAAGNEAFNADSLIHFPNPKLLNGSIVNNWITVGASSDLSIDQRLPDGAKYHSLSAYFSNYGQSVDVFAPGMKIYSTTPENTYTNEQGTSMASPVVTGIAALILEYYPTLSAQQVKYCIEKSVVAPSSDVILPGTDQKVKMSVLCKTGGIVNAYEAIKIASGLKGERGTGKEMKPF